MDSEKELLKQDLNNQEKPEEIEKFIEDAELLGHEDIAVLGRKKLKEILEKADNIEKTSETQISQVNELGGSNEVLKSKTQEVDEKIEDVKEETQSKIAEVQNENQGELINETVKNDNIRKNFYNIEQPKKPDEIDKYKETLKLRYEELPAEYKQSVEDIMQLLNDPVAQELASQSFGGNAKDPVQKKEIRDSIFRELSDLEIVEEKFRGGFSNSLNVFDDLVKKYPGKEIALKKMKDILEERQAILAKVRIYNGVKAVCDDPIKIENLFTYSQDGKNWDEPNMNLINGWYNSRIGEKLVELGVITNEELQNKLKKFMEQAEHFDSYLAEKKRYPEEYKRWTDNFKKEIGII